MSETPAKLQHPTISDVALALATRRSDPLSKVSLTRNAKGDVQIEVDVTDPDAKVAAEKARDLFDVLRTTYPRTDDGNRDAREARSTLQATESDSERTEP